MSRPSTRRLRSGATARHEDLLDSNVYIAEALLGRAARNLFRGTLRAKWRIYTSAYVIEEVAHVIVDDLGFSKRFASLTQQRIAQRAVMVKSKRAVHVPRDRKDSPILQTALTCGAHYLVSNDRHLLQLDPFESLRIVSMADYHRVLEDHGHIKRR